MYPNDRITNLIGLDKTTVFEENNISPNQFDILSFDKIFLECDIAQGMFFKRKRSGIIHKFTMDVNNGYEDIDKFHGGVQCYMMECKDNISSVCFKFKNENNQLVSFNGKNITFRFSIKEV